MSAKKKVKPIFYDPHRRRWKWFSWGVRIIAIEILIIFGLLVYRVVQNPQLPTLALRTVLDLNETHHFLLTPQKHGFQETKAQLYTYLQKSPARKVKITPPHNTEMIGFLVNWDDASFSSLKKNISHLTTIIPEWIHVANDKGDIELDAPSQQNQIVDYIAKNKPSLKIVPLINNYDGDKNEWDQQKIAVVLASEATRQHLIQGLKTYVQKNNFAGVNIDFENIPISSQENLDTFMGELSTEFHKSGLLVTQSLPADNGDYDYQQLAAANDYVIMMMYDEHWSESTPGPLASQQWFEKNVKAIVSQIPANKVVIALGNYGYDWASDQTAASEVSFQQAVTTARQRDISLQLDPQTLNMSYSYSDEAGHDHQVWFLDGVTAFNEVLASNGVAATRGVAIWRLGSEDPSFWNYIDQREQLSSAQLSTLQNFHYGYDVDYEGHGEVLKITQTPQDGTREVSFDPNLGLIMESHFINYPSPYVITRWGASDEKKVVLSFDDGPDPQYTPQILDILKRYHVPGTFFVIGIHGDVYPDILQRTVNEGNEIGVHTFTHPNIATISHEQLNLEINATQRLFESRVGRSSLLFRPPYAEDIEPNTTDQVRPLVSVGELGYYTVGMQVDPSDWKQPGVDTIVQSTVDQVTQGRGNIILLHDGGGDRSQTVQALPLIIEKLEAQGYHFTSVAELLHLKRDDVMPPLSVQDLVLAKVSDSGFTLLRWFNVGVPLFFLVGIVLGLSRLAILGILAIVESVSDDYRTYDRSYRPSVSVIVPAYNEEKGIVKTVRSILRSEYQNFEVIVVDDGSSDGTLGRVQKYFGNDERVRIFSLTNQGKASALNFGLKKSRAEVVVLVDADTILDPYAVPLLVRHFADPHVGAVAGNAKVGNRQTVLTKWQALEYITSQNLDRRAFSLVNGVTVVPGAIGAWRRKVMRSSGGFSYATLAEDADFTLFLLKQGYRVHYEDLALAYTEAPSTFSGFLKQRFRWTFGTMQVFWKHRRMLFSRDEKVLGFIVLPNILIFQILFQLVSPLMDALMVGSLIQMVMQYLQHPNDWNPDRFRLIAVYYVLFVMVDFLTAVVAFLLEKKEDWKLIFWLFWQRFLYRQLMYYVVVKACLVAIRGSHVGWNKLERSGMERE